MMILTEPSSSFPATASIVNNVLAVNSSEAASLGGKKAKTPIIAGSICGGVMGIAWIIGFAIYFRKRYKRKQRKRLAAQGVPVPPREKDTKNTPDEKIVIPPDPAVLLGQLKPGEVAFTNPSNLDGHDGHHRHKGAHDTRAVQLDMPVPAGTLKVVESKSLPPGQVEAAVDAVISKGNHSPSQEHTI